MTTVRSLGPSELYVPFPLHKRGFSRSLILLLYKLEEETSVRITVNVAEDGLTILCTLICVVEATTTIEISSEQRAERQFLTGQNRKNQSEIKQGEPTYTAAPRTPSPHSPSDTQRHIPHAETHEHRNDEAVALLVAYEYERFRDVVREFREAFYARGIEAGDVDREVTLKVEDV